MVVLVDAYNVMRSSAWTDANVVRYSDERLKDLFITDVVRYASAKKNTITELYLVFDGGSLRYAERYRRGSTVIVSSGYVQSADDWIVAFAQKNRDKEVLLVTNDRGLMRRTGGAVEHYMDTDSFVQKVRGCRVVADEPGALHKKTSKPLNPLLTKSLSGVSLDEYDEQYEADQERLEALMESSTRALSPKGEDLAADDSDNGRSSSGVKLSKKEKKELRISKKL